MAYNNYGGFSYGYPQYNPNMGYQQFQQNMGQPQQQMMQPQQQGNDMPFAEVLFGNLKEAEARVVYPNKSICFVNNALGEIYVKSADNMGNQSFRTYKDTGFEQKIEESKPEIDTKSFIKREELKDYITFDDLNRLNEHINKIETKVDKALRLQELLGGKQDGK